MCAFSLYCAYRVRFKFALRLNKKPQNIYQNIDRASFALSPVERLISHESTVETILQ